MKKLLLLLLCVPLMFSCGEKTEDTGIIPNEGWSQSDISLYVKTCQEGWGDYTQESKDYCECIVRRCMAVWDSKKEMEEYFSKINYIEGTIISTEIVDTEEWARSCR